MNQDETKESSASSNEITDDVTFINESELSVNSILVKNSTAQNANFHVLNWKQVKRLDDLLNSCVPIHGRGNFPTLNIKLKDFIRNLRKRLTKQRVRIRDIRINGGVASNILAEEHDYEFSDIDIVYSCDLLQLDSSDTTTTTTTPNTTTMTAHEHEHDAATAASRSAHFSNNLEFSFSYCCDIIKQTVLECLLDYFPNNNQTENVSWQHLKEAYVKKMTKIYQTSTASTTSQTDDSNLSSSPPSSDSTAMATSTTSRWSLISFCNDQGKNIELKFVDQMKRQFQFSVDSFQIHLDSLLRYYDCQDSLKHHNQLQQIQPPLQAWSVPQFSYSSRLTNQPNSNDMNSNQKQFSSNFFPSVLAESKYGNFAESLHHLNAKLIATRSPEEIRGGGLLKYCNLLIRGYKSVCDDKQMASIEKYMCSRFFIDFSDLKDQEYKLNTYLDSHFQNDSYMCGVYLKRLFQIVNTSTVCLMGHERKQTLHLIESMARQFDSKFKSDRGGGGSVLLDSSKNSSAQHHHNHNHNHHNHQDGQKANSYYKNEKQRHKKKLNSPMPHSTTNNNNKSHHMNQLSQQQQQQHHRQHHQNSLVPSIKLEYLTNSDISLRSSISSSASLSTSTSPSLSVSHSPSHSPIQSPSPSPSPASSTSNSRIPSPLDQKNNKVNYSSFLKNNNITNNNSTTNNNNNNSSSSSSYSSATSGIGSSQSSSFSSSSSSSSSSSDREQKLIMTSSKNAKYVNEVSSEISNINSSNSNNIYQCKVSPSLFSHIEVFNNYFCPPYFPELVTLNSNFNQQSTWVVAPTK